MSRRLSSLLLIGVLAIGCIMIPENKVLASSNEDKGMQLVYSEEAFQGEGKIGYIQVMPRGRYLQTGFSSISKAGEGLLTAGGATFAQMVVDNISIDVDVEMLDSNGWKSVESWSESKKNDSAVMTSKTFKAKSGIYRVTCFHKANTDSSSSTTDMFYFE